MLVITGFGRSGTSLMAKFMQEMGLLWYEAPWFDDINAGLEPMDVCEINNAILGHVLVEGKGYVKGEPAAPGAYSEQIKKIDYYVFKCPRFMYGNVLDEWIAARNDLRFLILMRDLNAIYTSRQRQKELYKGAGDFIMEPDAMMMKTGQVIMTLTRNKIPFRTLHFPEFINYYYHVHDTFHDLGVPFDFKRGWEVWSSIVDKTKIHH